MTLLERAIAAVNTTAVVRDIAGDQQGVVGNAPFHVVVNPDEVVRAVLTAICEPSPAMVRAAVLSTVEVSDDERDAEREFRTEFAAAIDAALHEGEQVSTRP